MPFTANVRVEDFLRVGKKTTGPAPQAALFRHNVIVCFWIEVSGKINSASCTIIAFLAREELSVFGVIFVVERQCVLQHFDSIVSCKVAGTASVKLFRGSRGWQQHCRRVGSNHGSGSKNRSCGSGSGRVSFGVILQDIPVSSSKGTKFTLYWWLVGCVRGHFGSVWVLWFLSSTFKHFLANLAAFNKHTRVAFSLQMHKKITTNFGRKTAWITWKRFRACHWDNSLEV